MKLNEAQLELHYSVDRLLWEEWDPIGINDIAPDDEYRSYVPQIFDMVIRNGSANEVAQRLHYIETETIGVIGDIEKCREIAQKIILWKNELIGE